MSQPQWKVRMDKHRSTWSWFTTNPQGGGFGSNEVAPKYLVLAKAVRNIPVGQQYELTCNGVVTVETREGV